MLRQAGQQIEYGRAPELEERIRFSAIHLLKDQCRSDAFLWRGLRLGWSPGDSNLPILFTGSHPTKRTLRQGGFAGPWYDDA